jgi:hypothetical protein
MPESENRDQYALKIANASYAWYRTAAIRSRRAFRATEVLIIIFGAAVPVSVLLWPRAPILPGVLGSAVVVLTGVRAVFHWQENYLRFSRSREAVEAERRAYHTAAAPYDDSGTRAQRLVASVTRIEQEEMGKWLQLSADQRPGRTGVASNSEGDDRIDGRNPSLMND